MTDELDSGRIRHMSEPLSVEFHQSESHVIEINGSPMRDELLLRRINPGGPLGNGEVPPSALKGARDSARFARLSPVVMPPHLPRCWTVRGHVAGDRPFTWAITGTFDTLAPSLMQLLNCGMLIKEDR